MREQNEAAEKLKLERDGYDFLTSEWIAANSLWEAARAAQVIKDLSPEVLHALVHGCFIGLVREARAGEIELTDEVIEATEACVWEAIRR